MTIHELQMLGGSVAVDSNFGQAVNVSCANNPSDVQQVKLTVTATVLCAGVDQVCMVLLFWLGDLARLSSPRAQFPLGAHQ